VAGRWLGCGGSPSAASLTQRPFLLPLRPPKTKQILEDGRLTDSAGRVVSFKSALVVLTSNIGSRAIAASGRSRLPVAFPAAGAGGAAEAEVEDARAPAAVARTTVRRALFLLPRPCRDAPRGAPTTLPEP